MVLEISKLNKIINKKEILKDISLEFQEGQIYSILGGNGSGKTTLFQCISGDLKYESGTISIKDGGRAVLAHKHGMLPDHLTGYQFMEFVCANAGEAFENHTVDINTVDTDKVDTDKVDTDKVDTDKNDTDKNDTDKNDTDTDKMDALFNIVKLSEPVRHTLIKEYDFISKRRLQLAQFLVQKPYIMMFDEPFDYRNDSYIDSFLEVLESLKNDHIILVSTGLLDIAKKISGDTVLLRTGQASIYKKGSLHNKQIANSVLELLGEDEDEQ